jgi:hypothetical protein
MTEISRSTNGRQTDSEENLQPKIRQNIGRPQLSWRDQHNFQEDGTNQERPNP